MKKMLVACITVMLLVSIFMGRTIFTSMAKEENQATPFYKSIQIKKGDNLWNIADQYKERSSMDTHEYVDCLIQMNSLKNDRIHAGQYLTVVYFQ